MTGRGFDRQAFRRTCAWPCVRRSLIVALVIGTVLNAINQGPEILSGQAVVVWKLALTFLVPFLVASFGSYAAYAATIDARDPPVDGRP